MSSKPGMQQQQGGPASQGAPSMLGPNMFGGGQGPPPIPTPPPGGAPQMNPMLQSPPHLQQGMPAMPPGGGGFMQSLMQRLPPQLSANPQFMHLMQMLGGGLGGGQGFGGSGGTMPGISGPGSPVGIM